MKSFAEFQIFLNIFKIFESILLSFLFSPYILEQFLRTSQNSICIMKDFPQRENPLEVFNGMNWVKINSIKIQSRGTFLVVQCLRLYAPCKGALGSISGWGITSCMPQLRPSTAK